MPPVTATPALAAVMTRRRVRDGAARLREEAARARDAANQVREEINRQRMSTSPFDNRELWAELMQLDRALAHQNREALIREREASNLDRQASSKDRESSERDRDAAGQDRAAADMDRAAAERDRDAAEADRSAADVDRNEVEDELSLHESWLGDADSLSSLGRVAAQGVSVVGFPIARLLQTLRLQLGTSNESSIEEAKVLAHQLSELRLETDTLFDPIERRELDLVKLVQGAIRSQGTRIADSAPIHFDDRPMPDVWGVAPQIERAIGHLLVNASQAIVGQACRQRDSRHARREPGPGADRHSRFGHWHHRHRPAAHLRALLHHPFRAQRRRHRVDHRQPSRRGPWGNDSPWRPR